MFHKRQFHYDAERDIYVCPNQQLLIYRTTNREGYRQYHSEPAQCRQCGCASSAPAAETAQDRHRHVWQDSRERADATVWNRTANASNKRRKENRGAQLRRCQTVARTSLRQNARSGAKPASSVCSPLPHKI